MIERNSKAASASTPFDVILPSAEEFQRTIESLSNMGRQALEVCAGLADQLDAARTQASVVETGLRNELQERTEALDQVQKQLLGARSGLAEAKRSLASMAIQIQQMSETLMNHQHDVVEVEELNAEIRALRAEKVHLTAAVEELRAEGIRAARLNADAVECLKLQHVQEKLVLHENLKAAEDRAAQLLEAAKRDQEQLRQADERQRMFNEELARAKREDKVRFDKVRGDLLHHQSLLADQERLYQDLQKDLDRQVRAGILKAEQQDKTAMNDLKQRLEENERQLRLSGFRLTQMAEDYQRALVSAKTDYETQLNMKIEEVRRHFYAKSKGARV